MVGDVGRIMANLQPSTVNTPIDLVDCNIKSINKTYYLMYNFLLNCSDIHADSIFINGRTSDELYQYQSEKYCAYHFIQQCRWLMANFSSLSADAVCSLFKITMPKAIMEIQRMCFNPQDEESWVQLALIIECYEARYALSGGHTRDYWYQVIEEYKNMII